MTQLCPDDQLSSAVAILERDDKAGLVRLADLICEYPDDPRLPFLQGSVLAGLRRYDEAREAMSRAIAIEPDYTICRFQLGFLEYTSGEPTTADRTWGPLGSLPAEHGLRLFAEGLRELAQGSEAAAIALLERGLTSNVENPALNGDMRRLIDELRKQRPMDGDEPVSSTQMLLQQSDLRTRH